MPQAAVASSKLACKSRAGKAALEKRGITYISTLSTLIPQAAVASSRTTCNIRMFEYQSSDTLIEEKSALVSKL